MATGIGNLPYPMPPVSPFDLVTSQAENERIANIEALADGTGIGDKAIPAGKIDLTTLKIKFGQIPAATFSTTGNKTISGLGFRPRFVRFTLLQTSAATSARTLQGVATSSSSQYCTYTLSSETSASGTTTNSSETYCICWRENKTTDGMRSSFVNFTDDGFIINVNLANGAIPIQYEAWQ